MRKLSWLLGAVLLAACASPAVEQPDTVPAPRADEGRVVGVVRVVGSTPLTRVVVQPDSGRSVEVEGALAAELRRLTGVRVAVAGPVRSAPDPIVDRRVEATGYEILSVDGAPVLTGTVQGRSGDWVVLRTEGGETVYLGGAADALEPGQKVWVQGPRALVVQSYGVVQP